MKRIDSETQKKLICLFLPLICTVLIEMTYLWFNINIFELWFGININILRWCKPALLGAVVIIFIGYSIAAIRQKCWGEFTIAIVIFFIMLLNMINLFSI